MQKITKFILAGLCLASLSTFMTGCGEQTSSNAANLQPDFSYGSEEQSDDTGLTIAVVDPGLVDPDVVAPPPGPDTPAYAVAADGYTVEAQMQIGLMNKDASSKRFRKMFEQNYADQLIDATKTAVTQIHEDKGFMVQPVHSYTEVIKDGDAQGFLASMPSYTLGIGNNTTSEECANNICTQKGKLLIDGQYLFQMAEPQTGTTVAYRRMNLYGLRIEEPYTIQTYETDPGAMSKVKELVGLQDPLVDTSQQALAAGLTKLYQNTMAETDRTISRPQILAIKKTLDNLQNNPAP